jgi:hypothetical protein
MAVHVIEFVLPNGVTIRQTCNEEPDLQDIDTLANVTVDSLTDEQKVGLDFERHIVFNFVVNNTRRGSGWIGPWRPIGPRNH